MRPAQHLLLAALLTAPLSSCGARPSPYEQAMTAAAAEAREKRAGEAAALYQEAARKAPRKDLEAEARYREAWVWQRAGQLERALSCLEKLAADGAGPSRQPRVWLDIGRLRAKNGNSVGAHAAYREVLAYPESGLAPRAADAIANEAAIPRSKAYEALLPLAGPSTALDAFLRWRIAQAKADEGDLRGAIAQAEDLARRHPLPIGAYTDDALLLAARSRRVLGDDAGALATIEAFLSAEEKAALVGSYERATYAEARFLAADIYQVDRKDGPRAEAMLEELVQNDETSRLRDDALFRAAWLAHESGRNDVACSRARRLRELAPPSPLASCTGIVCAGEPNAERGSRRCERAVLMAAGTPRTSAPEASASTEASEKPSAERTDPEPPLSPDPNEP